MNPEVEKLKVAARALRSRLAHYAEADDTAADVLGWMEPWFEQIERGEVIPPASDNGNCGWYFASPDGGLFKYRDLLELHAEYTSILRQWCP